MSCSFNQKYLVFCFQVCENSQLTTTDGATQLTDRSISDQFHPMTTNFVNKGDESCQQQHQQDEVSSRQPQQQLNSSCMRSRLSSIIPRYEKLETKVRSVRCDMRKLRYFHPNRLDCKVAPYTEKVLSRPWDLYFLPHYFVRNCENRTISPKIFKPSHYFSVFTALFSWEPSS